MPKRSDVKIAVDKKLREDFEFFAEHTLQIKYLDQSFGPFKLNRAQKRLQEIIEQQEESQGYVRLVVLKGRKMGCSTYIFGRDFWKTVMNQWVESFIFAHVAHSSSSLFRTVKSFYSHMPAAIKPKADRESNTMLNFPELHSNISVGTGGGKDLGRGFQNLTRLHWSEVAFTDDAEEHSAGIVTAVPTQKETSIILESTAGGSAGYFYTAYQAGLKSESDWKSVFLPWYWEDTYKKSLSEDFTLSDIPELKNIMSEKEYYETYKNDGLTLEHLSWRRNKIHGDLKGDIKKFVREFPFNSTEAFLSKNTGSYISIENLTTAINTSPQSLPPQSKEIPLIGGIDTAGQRELSDASVAVVRHGRHITNIEELQAIDPDHLINLIIEFINDFKLDMTFMDAGHSGLSIAQSVKNRGYKDRLQTIEFGGLPMDRDRFQNKRAEMYSTYNDWLSEMPAAISTSKEIAEMLLADASAITDESRTDKLRLIEKKILRKKLGRSTDHSDAIALTFAKRVRKNIPGNFAPIKIDLEFNPYTT